jgi:hypothetical protein
MTTSDFTQELHFITATIVDWIDVFTRPDYKRTIYWNPEVTTDAEGRATVSFYNNGYYPSDGAACRFIMAIVDAVPDPPPDGPDPVALFVRTLREAPSVKG